MHRDMTIPFFVFPSPRLISRALNSFLRPGLAFKNT